MDREAMIDCLLEDYGDYLDELSDEHIKEIVESGNFTYSRVLEDKKEEKEESTWEDDLVSDFIADELDGITEFKVLDKDDKILDKIRKKLENNAMGYSGRSHLSGSFADVESISGVKYKNLDDKKWVIMVFAHTKTGIADEDGKASEEWDSTSLWTVKGEYIEDY